MLLFPSDMFRLLSEVSGNVTERIPTEEDFLLSFERTSSIRMKERTDAPRDRGCMVGVIFFILGLGTLLPWNFFMTASLYFQARLNTTEWSNGTVVVGKEYYFNNWMTLLSQLPLLLFTLLNSFLYQRISEGIRIAGSLVFILLLFIFTAVLVKVPMEKDGFFSITMATIWFINSFGAVLQGSLFGLVGLLPQRYSAIFMSGQGLAGTFAAIAMLIAIGSDADSETAALGYFITPCVGTLLTLFSYMLLPRLEFAQHYLNKSSKYEAETRDELLKESGTTENGKLNGHANGSAACSADEVETDPNSDATKHAFLSMEPDQDKEPPKASVMEVFKKIWVMAFCVTFVFTVTLSVFPAVTVDVRTSFPDTKWERFFISTCCFLIFNINDWLGRTITTWLRWPSKESRLFPMLVISRVIFIPLLMLCNVQSRSYLPVYFHHDAAFTAIMCLFSLSSGYFVCLSMSYAPQLVEPKDGETAGALMTFFLALGLSIGAAVSFPLRALV
ncbi:equilibrative nucleoside transporter 2 isoform X2 [Cheilinus undulatus]|uniref:equilibrative nucleoside transporter 2 isoform X2 n=1 Tax=Cheilinus undulatus TaxID=241271 RepID=UPI001BD2A622|nr:equilibrative nucleoside transporter 2 isoform X2 [Cheilinus undulatus]